MKSLLALSLVVFLLPLSTIYPTIEPAGEVAFRTTMLTAANPAQPQLAVSIVKPKGQALMVSLTTPVGRTVDLKVVRRSDTATTVQFDLAHLPDGEYVVFLSDKTHTVRHRFLLQTGDARHDTAQRIVRQLA